MTDLKLEAAKAALQYIKPGQTIGLGAGSTIAHLVNLIATETKLAGTLTFTSSSFKTTGLLVQKGLNVKAPALLKYIDIYFDGCDQFDPELNALKSGGGIHTTEKILASMAAEFILLGDAAKFAPQLDTTYPMVIEVLPAALQIVLHQLTTNFPGATLKQRISTQKDGAVISDNGNMLIDVYFDKLLPLNELNISIGMIPGIVEHSLFYKVAAKAIIAGEDGISVITPSYK
ncbi:ribose 5-phosphate isomerase A [Mucilaginibacter dorajii]|uniref:Ribose 5-phosphate isomerase A n=1 Tax=Mucilaginibacter dorajii TaxID=692994 RepID=A0ABP7P3W2_9SPHI|nr:ribose 5-phosphate isomerase A [Mucilaginibacter dorajii]MCS3734370.1 ribose 5-phosphate isomerase A [Mucilaginibacter dorajii]